MATKAKATKTINPLHFEDLEPHRFEDLVRRLLYGFRDWTNIEATGRGGADDGFDIRAWEKGDTVTNVGAEGEEGVRDLEGRLWQIQGKREKSIPPAKMRALIKEGVNGEKPPYGYILAAATNISKIAYDAFREELRKKRVTEFHFWGKDYLEDQLALPQNDEILFTFFGLSLSPRRKSRTAELKFAINNKNRVLKLIFGNDRMLPNQGVPRKKTFFLRDIKAEHYPDARKYPDFETNRRWGEFDVVDVSAKGLCFKVREWYAYCEPAKKEWDFTRVVDLTPRQHNLDRANQARLEKQGQNAETYWRHLPRRLQAKLMVYGFVPFEEMLIIDDKGDPEYTDPHVLVDFGSNGPFQYTFASLVQHRSEVADFQTFKKVQFFPPAFPEPNKGAAHEIDRLGLNSEALRRLEYLRGATALYSFDGKLGVLTVGDLIRLPQKDQGSSEKFAEVTHIFKTTVGTLVKEQGSEFYRAELERSAGRKITDVDEVVVYELLGLMAYGGGHLRSYENGD